MRPNLFIKYENMTILSVTSGRAAASGGPIKDKKILHSIGFTWNIYFYKIYTRTKSGAFFTDHWRRNAPPAGGCCILFNFS